MVGVKTMALINNFGVAEELVGMTLLNIFLGMHIRRSPAVIFDTFATGATYPRGGSSCPVRRVEIANAYSK